MRKSWFVEPAKANELMEEIGDAIAESVPEIEKKMPSKLLFEEAFMNVANYAYQENGGKKIIWIMLDELDDGSRRMIFEDYGVEFDPTNFVPDTPDKFKVGGHGIRMIQQLSESLYYTRILGRVNHLEIWI